MERKIIQFREGSLALILGRPALFLYQRATLKLIFYIVSSSHLHREDHVGHIPIMRKAGLPSAALGAAFAPLLTVCSAVLARGTPATLSAMLG